MPDTALDSVLESVLESGGLDSSGGAALHGRCGNRDGGRRLVLQEPRLRALDLHDDPALEVLDLSGCGQQRNLHLQLDRLPRLREIHLPPLTEGAILHLFYLDVPASLTVHGAVREIDADWQQGTLRLAHPQRYWNSMQLLGHDAGPDALRDASRALPLNVVLSAAPLQALATHSALHLSAPGTWYLADASGLDHLTLAGPERLHLMRACHLRTLELRAPAHVEGEQLDALTQLAACTAPAAEHSAPSAALLRGNMPSLAFVGAWGDVQLHTPRLEHLALSAADSLTLYRCEGLESVSLPNGLSVDCHGTVPTPLLHVARFYIDEATLRQTLKRLQAGEHALLDSVLTMLPQRAGSAAAFHALTLLLQLAEQGYDADALWHCRRQLAAWQGVAHRHRRRTKLTDHDLARADGVWRWDLPTDRHDEGLLADLRLWALCSAHSAAAGAYRKTLLASCSNVQALKEILRFGSRPDAPAPLRQLMLEALVEQQTKGGLLDRVGGSGSRVHHRYLVRILNHDESLSAKQRQALLGAISEIAPWEALPQLVATLLAQHPGPVRALLMTLSRRPDGWFRRRLPGYPSARCVRQARLQLTQLALMPAGAALDERIPMPTHVRR